MLASNDIAIEPKCGTLFAVFNSIREGVVIAERHGSHVYVNRAAKAMLRLSQDSFSRSDWLNVHGCHDPTTLTLCSPDQLPLARALEGEVVENELFFIRKPEWDSGIFVKVSANPIRGPYDEVLGGTVSFRDVTAKKQGEDRVKAQFDGIPIPTYVWQRQNADFRLIDFNQAAEQFSQGTVRKLLGTQCRELYAHSPDIKRDFLQCYETRQTIKRELSYQFRHSNEVKDLIVTYVFVPPDVVMVLAEDITDRKRALQELSKLHNAVEQTAESIMITNKRGVIEYVNPAFSHTTGFNRREVVGKRPDVLKSGKHDRAFYEHLWRTILAGEPYRGSIVNKKKNGQLYWSEQTITPMLDGQGEITHFVAVLKDITERRQKQEQEFYLRLAQDVQRHLYKANFQTPGLDVFGEAHSAMDTCGDYFDLISQPDGSTLLAVGDVCGHGVGSALIMGTTRAYLRAFARTDSNPGRLITRMNRELAADLEPKHFVTLIVVRIHREEMWLDFANAGHVPGFVLNRDKEIERKMERSALPLGILPDQVYPSSQPIPIKEGNIIALFTDGITEAQGPDSEEWGTRGALDWVKACSDRSAKEIVTGLIQHVRQNRKTDDLVDDVTSMICKITPH